MMPLILLTCSRRDSWVQLRRGCLIQQLLTWPDSQMHFTLPRDSLFLERACGLISKVWLPLVDEKSLHMNYKEKWDLTLKSTVKLSHDLF